MKNITEEQIDKINGHLAKMTEAQQDVYMQKLEEAGVIQNILAKFGSPKNNLKKLVQQKATITKQIDAMIKVVSSSKAKGVTPEQINADVQALTNLRQKIDAINMNVQLDETVTTEGEKKENTTGENKQ